MNTNSFWIKGWMITLVSALFALAAKDANPRYVIVTYVAVPAFWLLDAFYLSQERQYRALYDVTRARDATDFSMDTSPYNTGRNTWLASLFSRTMLVLYPPVLGITLLIMFWIG
jgi:hypothetical protein